VRIHAHLLVFLCMIASLVYGESFDRPVATIRIDEDGVYHAGFMYWYGTQTPFLLPAEFAVVGHIESITESNRGPVCDSSRVRIKVGEVVVCPSSLAGLASRIEYLETEAGGDLAVGDSVLVFMTRYEGQFAIPNWRGTNTSIGYKLNQNQQFCDDDRFLALVRSGHAWDLETLTAEELRLWRCVDSEGLLEAFIRAKEESEEKHQTRTND
jgi:hypothetical protein